MNAPTHPGAHPGTAYRPEIDGLRAVAVVAVILYHAGWPGLPAGLLGVDLFFVISGYLISRLIVADLDAGRFSFAAFYERRVRRIVPALTVMALLCVPPALYVMLPDDLENFGQSLLATALSVNNVLVLLTSGYFDLSAEFRPLVHTWSLGVEEQYYLVVPLLIVAAARIGGRRGVAIGLSAVGLLSFAFCLYAARTIPSANFLLLPSRAWELATGGAVALVEPALRRSRVPTGALTIAGLAMTIVPIALIRDPSRLPGLSTLIPVGGICLILAFGGGRDAASRLLSWSPIVGLGLVSYSAYLYHQPLFAFARMTSLAPPGPATMALLILATFFCAWLSWRFVERPFRDRRRLPVRAMLAICAALTIACVAIGATLHLGDGFPSTWPAALRQEGALNPKVIAAYVDGPMRYVRAGFDPADPRPNVLVMGNSFARDFINSGVESGNLGRVELVYAPSLPCLKRGRHPTARLLREADVVVVTARYKPAMIACIARLPTMLRGRTTASLIVIGPKNFGYANDAVMLLPERQRRDLHIAPLAPQPALNMQAARLLPPDSYVDLMGMIGDSAGRVPVFTPGGQFISLDTGHLTRPGARYIGGVIFQHPSLRRLAQGDRRPAPTITSLAAAADARHSTPHLHRPGNTP